MGPIQGNIFQLSSTCCGRNDWPSWTPRLAVLFYFILGYFTTLFQVYSTVPRLPTCLSTLLQFSHFWGLVKVLNKIYWKCIQFCQCIFQSQSSRSLSRTGLSLSGHGGEEKEPSTAWNRTPAVQNNHHFIDWAIAAHHKYARYVSVITYCVNKMQMARLVQKLAKICTGINFHKSFIVSIREVWNSKLLWFSPSHFLSLLRLQTGLCSSFTNSHHKPLLSFAWNGPCFWEC